MPPPPPRGFMGRGPLTEEEKKNRPRVTWKLLKRIFSYLSPYKAQLAVVLGCILISSVLGLLPSVLTGKIVDDGLLGKNLRILVILISASLAVSLGSNLIKVGESYLNHWI